MHAVFIVGAGEIARRHADALTKLNGAARLAGVADPSDEARRAFGELHPGVPAFASAEELLAAPAGEDDIVVVATPPWTHGELAIRALESGRHVLCEKPFATDVATAQEMADSARRAGRLVGCCSCRFLGLPTSAAVAELVAAGTLGRPYRLTFVHRQQRARSGIENQPGTRWFLDAALSGGGVLSDLGPYDLAVLDELLRPESVTVTSAWVESPVAGTVPDGVRFDVEEQVGAVLVYRLPTGTEIVVDYERAACTHGEERQLVELEAVAGAVRWDWLMLRGGRVTITTDVDGKPVTRERRYEPSDDLHMFDRPLAYFVQKIRGEDAAIPTGEEAVFTFRCLQAIYEATATGVPVTVQRRR